MGGLAAGWLVESLARRETRATVPVALAFAVAGAAPDLDLLVGAHRGPSHGLGFAIIIWGLAYALTRRGLLAAALAAAYASHTLLDWMSKDTTAPIGSMALWPISRAYYESDLHLFTAISRQYWLPGFWRHNFFAVLREVAVVAPVLAGAALWRLKMVTRGRRHS
jgi:inner membrane protein